MLLLQRPPLQRRLLWRRDDSIKEHERAVVFIVISHFNGQVENQMQYFTPDCSRFGRLTRCRNEREGLRVCTAVRHHRDQGGVVQCQSRASTSVRCLGCRCRLHGGRCYRNLRFCECNVKTMNYCTCFCNWIVPPCAIAPETKPALSQSWPLLTDQFDAWAEQKKTSQPKFYRIISTGVLQSNWSQSDLRDSSLGVWNSHRESWTVNALPSQLLSCSLRIYCTSCYYDAV
jgi:hypothetical protein